MHPVRREPIDRSVRQPELGVSSRERLSLGDRVLGGQRQESGVTARSERERHRERRLAESHVQRSLGHPAHVPHIGDPERRIVGLTVERQIQLPSHCRRSTIRPNAPPCPHPEQAAVLALDQRLHPAIRLGCLVDQIN